MTIKLILINGPKSSGKDTLLNLYLNAYGDDVGYERISEPLKDALSVLAFNGDFMVDYNDQEVKNEIVPYSKLTVRESLIQLGDWSRQTFGPLFLSRQCGAKVKTGLEDLYDIVFVPDVRTEEDDDGIVDTCGLKLSEILVTRIYRDNHTFENDLGYYIEDNYIIDSGLGLFDLTNPKDEPESMLDKLVDHLEDL